jgi:ribosomal-protein-alanine N-acetyltransferase
MKGSKLSGAGFQVRAFKADDLNRVMEINFECLPENYSAYFYRELASSYPDTFLVAESDGEIQGYIMCRVERGFSKTRSFSTARLLHVVSIAVRESFRRRGMARALMDEAMKRGVASYKATECYLEVRIGNDAAIGLYEKLGFAKVKRNYGYYLDGEDAWVMAFPLS